MGSDTVESSFWASSFTERGPADFHFEFEFNMKGA